MVCNNLRMKRLFAIIFLIPNCFAFDASRAISITSKAIMKTESVSKIKKKYEKRIKKMIPRDYQEGVAIGAASVYSATRGEISTRAIKKMNIKILNGNMRPDVSYNFKDKNVDARVRIEWGF